jgi:hypothetical protein
MGTRTPEERARFAALRTAYEDAFLQFSLQVRLLQSLMSQPGLDGSAVEEVRLQVEQARFVYRECRDLLAQFILSGPRVQTKAVEIALAARVA